MFTWSHFWCDKNLIFKKVLIFITLEGPKYPKTADVIT